MKKSIAIVGAGPAALLLASFIDTTKYNVCIYEKNKTAGRKFLVAGSGGLNLSYADTIEALISQYSPDAFLEQSIHAFNNQDLRNWLYRIGINTFVGSSDRIFPEEGIKPIEVLNAIIKHVEEKGIKINYEHIWNGWDSNGNLTFDNGKVDESEFKIFSMGGASWKVTGSDGGWKQIFETAGVNCNDFVASNCGYKMKWPADFVEKHEGNPLKNIALTYDDVSIKGELVITNSGLEGNAIYALSPEIRSELSSDGKAILNLDLKPQLEIEKVIEKLSNKKDKKVTEVLKKYLKLSKTQIDLLKFNTDRESFINPKALAKKIKNIELVITGMADIDEAISTVGGVPLAALNENFELKNKENHFCIGEMLDYDAPTGGYLLQSCFSMGVYLAKHLNNRSID